MDHFLKKISLIIIGSIEYTSFLDSDDYINTKVPVIALTGNETDSRLNLYTKGVIDCLCKPVIDHEVIFRVKTILHYFCCVYIQTLNHKKYLILENNSDNPINSPIEIINRMGEQLKKYYPPFDNLNIL